MLTGIDQSRVGRSERKKMESNPGRSRWMWQEYGTAWKGSAIYHVTLSGAGHRSLFGKQGSHRIKQ